MLAWQGTKQSVLGANPDGHTQRALPVVEALHGVTDFRVLDTAPEASTQQVVIDVKVARSTLDAELIENFETLSPGGLESANVDLDAVAFCVYDEEDALQTFWSVTDACDMDREEAPWRPAWLAAL